VKNHPFSQLIQIHHQIRIERHIKIHTPLHLIHHKVVECLCHIPTDLQHIHQQQIIILTILRDRILPIHLQCLHQIYATNSYPNYTPYTPTTHGQTLSQTQGSTSLTDEQITTMLRSDVEDKIKKKLQEILAQSQAEMQALKQTEKDLQNGSKILTDMVSKINNEQSEVDTNITILNQKTSETEQLIEKLKQADEIDIDEAIVPATPLHKQLLAVFCEEQATQDIIYYLSEGFKRDVIDLDAYLKQVREQSRKQFLLRALIQKIRQKAGLPDM